MIDSTDIILENMVDDHCIDNVVHRLAELCDRKATKAYALGDAVLGDAWMRDHYTLKGAAEDVGEPA